MSNISFGNIVKVNAPAEIAGKIILMTKSHSRPNAELKNFIYGDEESKAFAFSFPENSEESYIFTGEEGKVYWKSHCELWDKLDYKYSRYKEDKVKDANTETPFEKHINNIRNLIASYPNEIKELNVEAFESKKPNNSVDFLA